MYLMTSNQREIRRKLRILEHAEATGNVGKTCRYFAGSAAPASIDGDRSIWRREKPD
jgi:hypothetical protein